jgi:uncharacterized membrane protein
VDLLRALLYGVSAQRPSHSLFVGGQQLPLEARMGGIFVGFLCALALVAFLGRLRARQSPGGLLGLACWALVALTGLDGLNAFLFDGNLPHLYAPNTLLRLATGLGAGFGLGLLAIPVVAGVLWPSTEEDASVEDGIEFATGLALAGLVGGLMLAGVSVLLWPLALLMLLGVLVAFGMGNLYVLVLVSRPHADGLAASALRGLIVSSLGLALLEIVGLSALRAWLATSLGFTW